MQWPTLLRTFYRWLWLHHPRLLMALWVLVQLWFLRRYHGPHFANDSARYLEYATNIAEHGTFERGHNLRYVLYPLFESLWLWLGAGWWGIVLGQMVVAGLAARAFYGAIRQLDDGRRGAAALATFAIIAWPDIQLFNAFLLTESLFISLTLLSIAAFVQVRLGRPRDWLLLMLALLAVLLVRPNGFLVPLAAALAGLDALRRRPDRRAWRAALLLLVLASPLLWQALNHQLETYYLMDTYQRGELIFRSPLWAVHQAAPLDMPPPGTGPAARVLYFAAHNPGYFGQLVLGKLFVFLSYLKPHYSLAHRILGVVILWPSYWLAARGAGLRRVWRPARVFLAGVFLLQAAIISFTVDDWDVRFLAPVLPAVFGLAALWLNLPPPAPSPAERGSRTVLGRE
ncbi:hypothetical protein Q5H93_10240 [Hymenobacter sp. ASUV-10]|uniref:Glycosyltransferase RgtA/B/C/D-like domain-containing protein n=1 Tax=Hymenobacter aranciens TaxID=3063996 RepID=A0ABT9BBF6_9BACT|nr:hypothetical protein [Hymenobacter sp. ASUV-10]MDO7875110.1 hypothetical protein [Hymenobacter sp. ASUV-10]